MQPLPRGLGGRPISSRTGVIRWSLVLLALVLLCATLYVAQQENAPEENSAKAASPFAPELNSGVSGDTGPQKRSESEKPIPSRGAIRGHLNLPVGVAPPTEWELVLKPSEFFKSGNAKGRRIAFSNSEVDFVVGELEFGTYDMRPRAEGMNSAWVPIGLSPEASEPFIEISISLAGVLTGRLEYPTGAPCEGVLVRLQRVAVLDQEDALDYSALTDISGTYEFPRLPDGDYEMRFGEDLNPLLEPKLIAFAAPSMHLPTQVLDRIGQITVTVLDDGGNPLPDVSITGSGSHGGLIDHFTDANGQARITGLRPGRFKIKTEHPGFASRVQVVDLDESQEALVRFELSL